MFHGIMKFFQGQPRLFLIFMVNIDDFLRDSSLVNGNFEFGKSVQIGGYFLPDSWKYLASTFVTIGLSEEKSR